MSALTCADAGVLPCHCCALIVRVPGTARRARCPRCGQGLHRRRPASVQGTWALLAAAALMYLPANLMPIMRVQTVTEDRSDTIMSGVVHLMQTGDWVIALIIFVASVAVPLAKLAVLALLLISVQRRSPWRPLQRTRLYHLIEDVGRWSMVDIYVVAVTVTLVQLRGLARFEPGPGALAFGAVVVLTMIAAMRFDPRLIWDPLRARHDA